MRIFLTGKQGGFELSLRQIPSLEILFQVTIPLKWLVDIEKSQKSTYAFAVVLSTVYEVTQAPVS